VVVVGSSIRHSSRVATTDSATWCPTRAACSAASRLWVDRSKNSRAVRYSKLGELETSTTTDAPSSAAASPSPVIVLTPSLGEAGVASWPSAASFETTPEPTSPVPPMTTILTRTLLGGPLLGRLAVDSSCSGS
jgi:hypothetical protein